MKRLALLLAALILSGCSLTNPIQLDTRLAFEKYWPTDIADRNLVSRRELTFSFAYNLKKMYPADYPDLQAWVACKSAGTMKEIRRREELVNRRYRRPDAWLGAGTPSYINLSYKERLGYEEKLRELHRFTGYVNSQIPEAYRTDRLNPDLPCTAESLAAAKRFVGNYEDGKYNWAGY